MVACDSQAFSTASEADKVLFILYDQPRISREKLSSSLMISDTSDTYDTVSNVSEESRYQGVDLEKKLDYIKTILHRHRQKEFVLMDQSENPPVYDLTDQGRRKIEVILREEQEGAVRAAKAREELEALQYRGLSATEMVSLFGEYFEDDGCLSEALLKAEKYVVLDFGSLAEFRPELAEDLLEQPERVLDAAKHALKNAHDANLEVQVKNTPSSSAISVKDLRSEHIGRLVTVDVEVEGASEARPVVTSITFECPMCGNIIPVLQLEEKVKHPSFCPCGRKSSFRVLMKHRRDEIKANLVQPLAELFGDSYLRSKINGFFRGSLASTKLARQLSPGKLFRLVAVVRDRSVPLKHGGFSVREDLVLDVIGAEPLEAYDFTLSFSDEEISAFQQAAGKKGFLSRLSESLFATHQGSEALKQAVTLQLLAGNFKDRRAEENLHVLLIGDPGTGKSENFLRPAVKAAPIGRYVEATKSSPVGLTGSAGTKDRYTEARLFEPGALPRAHRGFVAIDEVGALQDDDPKSLNESMASGTLTFDKANVHIKVFADVRVLAAMNPPKGRFSDYDGVVEAAEAVESSFIDRFGLIFELRDRPNEDQDRLVARKMFHEENEEPSFDFDWCRRFITYARHHVKPLMRVQEEKKITEFYVSLRQQPGRRPVGPRFLQSLKALVLLSAKVRLSSTTCEDDLRTAAFLLEPMLTSFNLVMPS